MWCPTRAAWSAWEGFCPSFMLWESIQRFHHSLPSSAGFRHSVSLRWGGGGGGRRQPLEIFCNLWLSVVLGWPSRHPAPSNIILDPLASVGAKIRKYWADALDPVVTLQHESSKDLWAGTSLSPGPISSGQERKWHQFFHFPLQKAAHAQKGFWYKLETQHWKVCVSILFETTCKLRSWCESVRGGKLLCHHPQAFKSFNRC